jgi:hypothetical protein
MEKGRDKTFTFAAGAAFLGFCKPGERQESFVGQTLSGELASGKCRNLFSVGDDQGDNFKVVAAAVAYGMRLSLASQHTVAGIDRKSFSVLGHASSAFADNIDFVLLLMWVQADAASRRQSQAGAESAMSAAELLLFEVMLYGDTAVAAAHPLALLTFVIAGSS